MGGFLAYGAGHEVLTEANLSEVYGMRIQLVRSVDKAGRESVMCRPVLDEL